MKINVYKIEILVVDIMGEAEDIKGIIENVRYPNDCINPTVMNIETQQVDWSDEHPLNKLSTMKEFYEQLFRGKSECPICRTPAEVTHEVK